MEYSHTQLMAEKQLSSVIEAFDKIVDTLERLVDLLKSYDISELMSKVYKFLSCELKKRSKKYGFSSNPQWTYKVTFVYRIDYLSGFI